LGDRNASIEAIAGKSGLTESVVSTALTSVRSTRSIDTSIGEGDDGPSLRDILALRNDSGPYNTDLEDVSLHDGLSGELARLSDRERYVIDMRFGIEGHKEHTLAEVAAKLGVSLERVRQIQVRAISKMRTPRLRKIADPFMN